MLQFDWNYMAPQKQAYSVVHADEKIVVGNPPKYNRTIYENVPYLEYEQQKIEEFKAEIDSNKEIQLPNDWKHSDYLKVLQCSDWKLKESMKLLLAHVQWRNDPLNHTLHAENLALLQKGIVYVHGRDKLFRPIVVLNSYLIDVKKDSQESIGQAISYFLSNVVKIMMIPYHIENWIMIIDTNNQGVSKLPLSALGKIVSSMQANFCGRLEKMYILNPSLSVNLIWKATSAFVNPITLQKIGFLTSKKIKQIQEKVEPTQLEQKYGGSQPNVTQYWPPINIDPIDQENQQIEIQENLPQEIIEIIEKHNPTQSARALYVQSGQELFNSEKKLPLMIASENQLNEIQSVHQNNKQPLTPSSNKEDLSNPIFSPSPFISTDITNQLQGAYGKSDMVREDIRLIKNDQDYLPSPGATERIRGQEEGEHANAIKSNLHNQKSAMKQKNFPLRKQDLDKKQLILTNEFTSEEYEKNPRVARIDANSNYQVDQPASQHACCSPCAIF